MQKAHENQNWENFPSINTPLNEQNLNKLDRSVDELDNRIITHEEVKATKVEVASLVADIEFDEQTGIFTITRKNGAKFTIDTLLETILTNWKYNKDTQQLILTMENGEKQYIDLSALITQYEFAETETISFSVDGTGNVSAIVKDGSIEEKHLQPNYLADIKMESAKAEAASSAAQTSEQNAKASEAASANSAKLASDNATSAATSATTATEKAESASNSADNAKESESSATESADIASQKAEESLESANNASNASADANTQASKAYNSAKDAATSAKEAESYTHGRTGTRENEDIDNAEHYYEQAKHIAQSGNGLVPMGTIAFNDLPTVEITTNAMYNINEDFTSDERFLDGGNKQYGAGSNVYYTSENKWDVLASSGVTGVKGGEESNYHQGNVNITKESIGLGNVENTKDINKNVNSAKTAATADKVKNALTFTGAVSATYDGSEAKTVNIPANTDTKVTQTAVTDSANYPILLAPKGQTTTQTTTACFDSGVTLNPNNNTIAANISGKATSAGTADKVAHALTFSGAASGTFDGSAAKTVDVQSTTGNTANNTVTFTSGDASGATDWTSVNVIASGETHNSLFNKISTMCKNVRWLFSKLGNVQTQINNISKSVSTLTSNVNLAVYNLVSYTYTAASPMTINNATTQTVTYNLSPPATAIQFPVSIMMNNTGWDGIICQGISVLSTTKINVTFVNLSGATRSVSPTLTVYYLIHK